MKKFWNKESIPVMWLLIGCCMLGTAAGAVFANIAYPYRGSEVQVLGIYVAQRLKDQNISSRDYLCYLLGQRFRSFLLFSFLGITGAARAAAVCGIVCMGFLAGAVGSMTMLEYGMRGLAFFLAANFPQALLLVPSMLGLLTGIYRINGRLWKKPAKVIKEYLILVLLSGLGCLLGVLLESYGNPLLLARIFP